MTKDKIKLNTYEIKEPDTDSLTSWWTETTDRDHEQHVIDLYEEKNRKKR
jgi:hypothetical protein